MGICSILVSVASLFFICLCFYGTRICVFGGRISACDGVVQDSSLLPSPSSAASPWEFQGLAHFYSFLFCIVRIVQEKVTRVPTLPGRDQWCKSHFRESKKCITKVNGWESARKELHCKCPNFLCIDPCRCPQPPVTHLIHSL